MVPSCSVHPTERETHRIWEKMILFDVSSTSGRGKFVIGTGPRSLDTGVLGRLGAHGMEERRDLLEGKTVEVLSRNHSLHPNPVEWKY